jgi:hypothetical protein
MTPALLVIVVDGKAAVLSHRWGIAVGGRRQRASCGPSGKVGFPVKLEDHAGIERTCDAYIHRFDNGSGAWFGCADRIIGREPRGREDQGRRGAAERMHCELQCL